MGKFAIAAVLSGGQTGVDRAALDAARTSGVPHAGWCPAERWAEDGPIAQRYSLRETPSADPAQRTGWNVYDSDATLLLSPLPLEGGSLLAARVAERLGRPLLVLPPTAESVPAATRWLSDLAGNVLLNVAGPRESEVPGVYSGSRHFMEALLSRRTPADRPERRALVTGGAGLLGEAVTRLAPPRWRVVPVVRRRRPDMPHAPAAELSEMSAVEQLFRTVAPELVIHTAYGTRDPERDILEATRNVALAAARYDARLVHVSTDMVLDGRNAPFDEAALPAPVSAYGRWKAEAEDVVREVCADAAIVRSSLLVQLDPPDPRTAWVIAGLRGESEVRLFVDEIRTPILVEDAARQIWEIATLPDGSRPGVWHIAGPESMSRFALGALIAAAYQLDAAALRPARSIDNAEPRPRDLRLLTPRANRILLSRPGPISAAAGAFRDRLPPISPTLPDG